MRDINECKAEIFRRSENRIKEIKKRRKKAILFVAMCLPLCVALSFAPMLFSGNVAADECYEPSGENEGYKGIESVNKDAPRPSNKAEGDKGGAQTTEVEHKNKEGAWGLTVKKASEGGTDVVEITNEGDITAIYATVKDAVEGGDYKEAVNQLLGPDDVYTLYFFDGAGECEEYRLRGQCIVRASDGKFAYISNGDAEALRNSFGFDD